jgi:hypothetical protein
MFSRLIEKAKAAPRPPAPLPRATITLPTAPILGRVVARAAAAARAPAVAQTRENVQLVARVAPLLPRASSPVARLIEKAKARPAAVRRPSMFAKAQERARARVAARPPGSTRAVPVSPVERAALLPAPATALPMPATSPFSLVPYAEPATSSTPAMPAYADVFPEEGIYETEAQPLEELAPVETSDVPDWWADTAYQSPAAENPEGASSMEPAGMQLDPLDELEQYEELAQGGDISQRELDTLKVELAQRTGATQSIPWGPIALFAGLLLWSYSRHGAGPGRGWR